MSDCNCKKDKCLSPAVLQINNQDCPTVFHKVTFPAAMGDDKTNPPRNGQYRNVLLVYEANKHVYMFSSDGIPTLISDGGQGVDDYNELTNKPSIDGHELVDDSSLEDIGVMDAIEEALEDYSPASEFAEVAFTGDYDDLIGAPTIPVVNDATLAITRNGTSAGTFTANSANNTTIDISVPTATSDLTNDSGFITNTVNNLANYYTKTETNSAIGTETANREDADQDLQEQIDALASASDVVDVVGTYADLQNYDTSHLNNNDIIKVLTDETHNDAISYYRWNTATSTFSYIGSQGPFYTKSESDATFVPQTRTINNKALSSDITLTASDVGALPDSTVIPTVNNATLTIQKEGSSIGTFTSNSATNTTVNIVETDPTVPSWAKQPTKPTYSYSEITNKPTIPTKTSDLTNDGSDGTSTYVEDNDLATVATSGSYNDLSDKPTIPAAQVNSDWSANSGVAQILNKPTLATVATSGSYNDLSDKPTIPTVNDATLTITQNGASAGTFTANASSDTTISLTDTTYSDFSGATSSAAGAHGLVPAPSAGDQEKVLHGDGTWQDATAKLIEMSYGESNAWAKFIAAYNAGSIVYCRASSNANPATGSQTRKAFMAYVNNAANPTNVEFQYVRSVSSKTASQPVDQVFVYTLTNASGGTWTVASRNMGPKLAAGTNTTVSYSNGTYTISATGGGGGGPTVVQTTGQSTTDVMSQKAVTDIIGNVETILRTLNSGNGAQ